MNLRLWPALFIAAALLLALSGPRLSAKISPPSRPLIRLKAATFDPLADEPQVAQSVRASVEAGGESTYLVQFSGPVTEAWKAAAAQAGARLYGYIPDYAFIARIDAADLARVRGLPAVRWVGLYHPAYRLDSELQSSASNGTSSLVVQTLPDANLAELAAQVGAWGGTVASSVASPIAGYLRAELPSARLADLAARQEVVWVAPYFAPRLFNNVGGGQIMRAAKVRQDLGLFGAGQTVAVADTGLDTGAASGLHPDFQGRLVKGYCLGRPSPCDWSDRNGHGTHVAGSVLGSGAASGSAPTAHQYPASAFAGVAPEARLVMQSIEDGQGSLGGIPDDSGDLMRQAYGDGARIHSNSWGGPTGGTAQNPQYGGYVADSQQVDQAAWEHKDMLILFAAGNEGADSNGNGVIDADSTGQPGTAKNVMTVGASENLRPDANGGCTWDGCFQGFGAAPLARDGVSDNADGMAAFSSRGPTDDGRIKPDIVAPGTNIISARSRHPAAGTGWGEYNSDYAFQGGTSMATPLAAGAAALVREWLTGVKGVASPSAALLRSLLINGAADMSPGQYGSGAAREILTQRPNSVTGWGRVDLLEALAPAAPRALWFADNQGGLATGASASYQVTISAPAGRERQAIAPQATTQLVQNGGFESATLAPWDTFGNPTLDPDIKHSGAQSAHLGGDDNKNDQIIQLLTIPADAADVTLDFWYRLDTVEAFPGADSFCYGLWDTTLQQSYLETCLDFASVGSQDWTHLVYTLTASERLAVAGSSLALAIYATTDFSDPSQAWVDDVALTAVESGIAPTATPTPKPVDLSPLRFTLSWTDYPGEPAGAKALVNDLDLEVVGPDGRRYSGNSGLYTSGQCLREAKWDACNNTEGVFIANAAAGTYTVIVHAAQVAQGGRQPFALAGSGNGLKAFQSAPTSTPTATSSPTATRSPTTTTTPAQLGYRQYLPTLRR
jgi:subtilisin family serine protease